jgi:hypothetical protein
VLTAGLGLGYVRGVSKADSLLARLDEHPGDASLRERAARALEADDRPAEAVALLQQGLIHFNAHEPGLLPCLCRRCIVPGDRRTTVAGSTFHRDFVVAEGQPRGRVLFFWIPQELVEPRGQNDQSRQRRRVRRSVLAGLRSRID